MSKSIKGKFPYKDGSKKKINSRKEQEKLLRKQDKEMKMQCECNHLDSKKNKTHFSYNEDRTIKTCKICKGQLLNTEDALDNDSIDMAIKVVYTVFGIVRNKLNVSDEMDKQITKTLHMVLRMPEIIKIMKDNNKKDKKKKKNNKKGKNNKNKRRSSYRISY